MRHFTCGEWGYLVLPSTRGSASASRVTSPSITSTASITVENKTTTLKILPGHRQIEAHYAPRNSNALNFNEKLRKTCISAIIPCLSTHRILKRLWQRYMFDNLMHYTWPFVLRRRHQYQQTCQAEGWYTTVMCGSKICRPHSDDSHYVWRLR